MKQTKLFLSTKRALPVMLGVLVMSGTAYAGTHPVPIGTQSTDRSGAMNNGQQSDRKISKKNKKVKPTELQGITVTGQLAALRREASIKRDAVGVVDSISADEAGKFPDQNVADALQRVPGVSVNRGGGEANQITVRGFGPTFVNVLLNGRAIAAASTNRAFNFDVLPSELIETAVVHKTGSADLPAGGIGGTVNIITAKPFDFRGFHVSAKVSGINDSIRGGFSKKTTPNVSGMIGNSNASKTFGWLASFVYLKRDHVEQAVDAEGWVPHLNYSYLNPAYTNVSMPQTVDGIVVNSKRARKSFNGAIEWTPLKSVSINLNALYSEYKQNNIMNAFGSFINSSDIKSITADKNGTALQYTRFNTGNLANDYIIQSNPSDAHNEQTGANINYQIDSSTEIDLDSSISKAWNKQSANGYWTVLGTRNIGVNPVFHNNGTTLMPSYSGLLPSTDTSNLHAHFINLGDQSPNVSDKIIENRLHFSKEFLNGALARLDFGVESQFHKERQVVWQTPGNFGCTEYCGYVANVPANAVDAQIFNAGSLVNGISPGMPTKWVTYNVAKLIAYYENPAAYNQLPNPGTFAAKLAANGGMTPRPDPTTFSMIKERVTAAYAKAKFEGTLGSMPWILDAGIRYTKTHTTSYANTAPVAAIFVNPNDTSNAIPTFGPLSERSVSGTYGSWLPAFDFKLNLRDDLIFRAAMSKTLTRPDLNYLSASRSYNFRPQDQTVQQGNVGLKPYTSLNFDTGIEWYMGGASYMSLDGFLKKVKNFTTLVTRTTTILGFPFLLTEPVNLNKATVKGLEATFNYRFRGVPAPFDDVGFAANYTYVTSSASINPGLIETKGKFAVPGIGNSANLSLYYDRDPLQLRLAYNWRATYLSTVAGAQGQPTTVKPYGELDFSSSYDLTRHVSVFFDMTNLTNETIHNYQVYLNRQNYAEANGRTVYAGFRMQWE